MIHTYGKKALGRGFGAHTLRHSFATHALEQEVNINTLAGCLGHKKVTTTVTYWR